MDVGIQVGVGGPLVAVVLVERCKMKCASMCFNELGDALVPFHVLFIGFLGTLFYGEVFFVGIMEGGCLVLLGIHVVDDGVDDLLETK